MKLLMPIMALLMIVVVADFSYIDVDTDMTVFMAAEPTGCGKCVLEITYVDTTKTEDDPLLKIDDWVGAACDGITGPGADYQDGSTGLMAIGHLNSESDGPSQELDEVWMGTYSNYVDDDDKPQLDFHTNSIFASDPEVQISDNWIQWRAVAELGVLDEWGYGNAYFQCWLLHNQTQPDLFDLDDEMWAVPFEVKVNLSKCASQTEIKHTGGIHIDDNTFVPPARGYTAADPSTMPGVDHLKWRGFFSPWEKPPTGPGKDDANDDRPDDPTPGANTDDGADDGADDSGVSGD